MPDHHTVSEKELALLKDQDFLLTKKQIDAKVTQLLLESQRVLSNYVKDKGLVIPKEISLNPRKIAKGENYGSLPYWVSDFPAILNKNDIWAFRVVVWWGHELSFNLILKGKYRPQLKSLALYQTKADLLYSTHSDPWKLELTPDYVIPLESTNHHYIEEHYSRSDFTKLTIKSELVKVNQLPLLSVSSFDKLIGVLNSLA